MTQALENTELSQCNSKPRYNFIYETLKNSVDGIKSVNDELREIRNKTIILEERNDFLLKKFHELINDIFSIEFKDVMTQSVLKEVHDIGVNCEIKPDYIDSDMQTEEPIVEIPLIIETVKCDIETDPIIVVDTIEVVKEPTDNQLYSKQDMLYYLERYKISFLSFVKYNKSDIESVSGDCSELIRSFSNNPDSEKRRSNKISECQSQKSMSDNNLGVIDTQDMHVDEGIMSSLYDDLDYNDLNSVKVDNKTVAKNDIEEIGGEKRISAMSNLVTKTFVNSKIEKSKRPKQSIDTWHKEISELATTNETQYPTKNEPVKKKSPIEVKKSSETVFDKRMKDKFDSKYNEPPRKLPTVTYDMGNADSPMFHTIEIVSPAKKNKVEKKLESEAPKEEKLKEKKKANPEKLKEEKKVEVKKQKEESKVKEDEKPVKRRHSSKKRSLKKDKDLEEGEID